MAWAKVLAGRALTAIATSASAQGVPIPAAQPAEFRLPNSRVIDFVSSVNLHRYRINVALPLVPPPPKGYRILYLFDGNGHFDSATERGTRQRQRARCDDRQHRLS